MTEKWHGTSGGYSNHKCRCDDCRLAWNKYCREKKRKKRLEYEFRESDAHGEEKTYQRGCKCPLCKTAHARYTAQLLKGGKPREGTCDICLVDGKVVWDHDHVTGDWRGWLCVPCNHGLGLFQDDTDIMKRAAEWLR